MTFNTDGTSSSSLWYLPFILQQAHSRDNTIQARAHPKPLPNLRAFVKKVWMQLGDIKR